MKLPVLSSKELCGFLEKEGFQAIRQAGSHRFFRHPDGRMTVVPIHATDLGIGLMLKILKQIKMSRNEFLRKYR